MVDLSTDEAQARLRELAEVEEAQALARYRQAQAAGDVRLIDHQDARTRLRYSAGDNL